jgi:hypothetical protein
MNRRSRASKPSAQHGYKLRFRLVAFLIGTSLFVAACGSTDDMNSSFASFSKEQKAQLVIGITTNSCGSFGALATDTTIGIYQFTNNTWEPVFESPTPLATSRATTITSPLGDGEWFAQFSTDPNGISSEGSGSIYGIIEPSTCAWTSLSIFDGMDTGTSISDLAWTTPSDPLTAYAWAGPDGPRADGTVQYDVENKMFRFVADPNSN